jgi:hypothetical protein
MPELRDDQIGIALLQHARQQCEVKVLNEYEGRLLADFFQDGAREQVIDLTVSLPVFRAEDGACKHDVTKRPERPVCKAVVVALFLQWR